jgi:hypothetical protein
VLWIRIRCFFPPGSGSGRNFSGSRISDPGYFWLWLRLRLRLCSWKCKKQEQVSLHSIFPVGSGIRDEKMFGSVTESGIRDKTSRIRNTVSKTLFHINDDKCRHCRYGHQLQLSVIWSYRKKLFCVQKCSNCNCNSQPAKSSFFKIPVYYTSKSLI